MTTLTLNRPEKRNALNVALFVELEAHLADLESEVDSIGVVVIRGAAGNFSSGADLSGPDRSPRRNFQSSVIDRLADLPQPTVGVVEGLCYTGGLELVLATDLLVTTESARFADTHGRWALTSGWGLSQRLPRRVGLAKAREMTLTGREYDGRQAESMGLANVCAPEGQLERVAAELLGDVLAQSWFSNREHKRIYGRTDGMTLADGLAHANYHNPGSGPDFAARLGTRFTPQQACASRKDPS